MITQGAHRALSGFRKLTLGAGMQYSDPQRPYVASRQ